jgi:hypothetical protein
MLRTFLSLGLDEGELTASPRTPYSREKYSVHELHIFLGKRRTRDHFVNCFLMRKSIKTGDRVEERKMFGRAVFSNYMFYLERKNKKNNYVIRSTRKKSDN